MNIAEVAKRAGVSRATVSRVLSGYPHVSAAVRDRVLQVIQQAQYSPSPIAQGLARGKIRSVGMIVPDIRNPFYAELARGAGDAAAQSQYSTLIGNTDESLPREMSLVHSMLAHAVAGLILVSADPDAMFGKMSGEPDGVPTVFAVRDPENALADMVTFDNLRGASLATEYLVRLGHRRIAFLGGLASSPACRRRQAGFERAIARAGSDILFSAQYEGDLTYEAGYAFGRDVPANHITAVFAANDLMALGVIDGVTRRGWRVPADLSVVGFDDSVVSAMPGIRLTTIRQPAYEMGVAAMERIIAKNTTNASLPPLRLCYPPELVQRSTADRLE
ncbi:MAG: LacI family DNA-binding transcriptional regulator [Thermaerobacter sp.]|nr:LacI family DNA-binding transcriptional regulator [Thermaerobacter sp.]